MENEIKEVVSELEKDVTELGADPIEEDTTDWKAEALKARGIAKRNATRLEKLKKAATAKVETVTPPQVENKKSFDYAEKAYLRASGISAEEFPLVQEVMQSTGKSLDEVLEAKYFQAELKERRDEKSSRDAIPSGSKRSASAARDSVEYWLAKGELPPADQRELRIKVVNARIASEKAKSQFTDHPIAFTS